jgi:hypothetical protein
MTQTQRGGHYSIRVFGPDYHTSPAQTRRNLNDIEDLARKIGIDKCDVRFVRADGSISEPFRLQKEQDA